MCVLFSSAMHSIVIMHMFCMRTMIYDILLLQVSLRTRLTTVSAEGETLVLTGPMRSSKVQRHCFCPLCMCMHACTYVLVCVCVCVCVCTPQASNIASHKFKFV